MPMQTAVSPKIHKLITVYSTNSAIPMPTVVRISSHARNLSQLRIRQRRTKPPMNSSIVLPKVDGKWYPDRKG